MCITDQPNRVCNKKSPPNACTSRDVEWNCSTNVLWAFHLHVFRVGLFGVFGPDKKCILMYYHLVTQCCSVFLKSLYVTFWCIMASYFWPSPTCFHVSHTKTDFLWLFSQRNGLKPTIRLCGFCRSLGSENLNYEKPQTINLLLFIDCKIPRIILFHVTVVLKYGLKTIKSGNTL